MSQKKSPRRWCCAPFKFNFENAGCRGATIRVSASPEGKPQFYLQHRAVDIEHQESLPKIPIPISLVSQTGVTYCPWCGRRLARFYRRTWEQLLEPDIPPI